jgi:hypothetical protein
MLAPRIPSRSLWSNMLLSSHGTCFSSLDHANCPLGASGTVKLAKKESAAKKAEPKTEKKTVEKKVVEKKPAATKAKKEAAPVSAPLSFIAIHCFSLTLHRSPRLLLLRRLLLRRRLLQSPPLRRQQSQSLLLSLLLSPRPMLASLARPLPLPPWRKRCHAFSERPSLAASPRLPLQSHPSPQRRRLHPRRRLLQRRQRLRKPHRRRLPHERVLSTISLFFLSISSRLVHMSSI